MTNLFTIIYLILVTVALVYGVKEYCKYVIEAKAINLASDILMEILGAGYTKCINPETGEEIEPDEVLDILGINDIEVEE